ncbi:Uncharacterized protein DAT39_013616 [Clarias magur]|uniref:Uncharacterized protein n=1 Tax=Clarias magur TaxID=1594786 RepID=A0A8J4UKH8_CLAMG|nr:Uncharacterized protein DAT39_013616 [Clarias magur]
MRYESARASGVELPPLGGARTPCTQAQSGIERIQWHGGALHFRPSTFSSRSERARRDTVTPSPP